MKLMRRPKFSYNLILLFMLSLPLAGCSDQEIGFSDVPAIELVRVEQFKDVKGKDSILAITFSYKDGDGDIGLTDGDTFPPFHAGSLYQYNLLVEIWEYSEGRRIPILDPGNDTMNFSRRIPDLQPTGKIKEISGDITVRYDSRPLILYPDTIQCELTLADRSLNLSNTIRTGLIILSH
jgi:hypothetical protein